MTYIVNLRSCNTDLYWILHCKETKPNLSLTKMLNYKQKHCALLEVVDWGLFFSSHYSVTANGNAGVRFQEDHFKCAVPVLVLCS